MFTGMSAPGYIKVLEERFEKLKIVLGAEYSYIYKIVLIIVEGIRRWHVTGEESLEEAAFWTLVEMPDM